MGCSCARGGRSEAYDPEADEEGKSPPIPFSPKDVFQRMSPKSIKARHPNLLSFQCNPEVPKNPCSPKIGPVAEGTEEYLVGDRRVKVTVWEPTAGEADVHVLYLGMALYMPWPMQKRSVELLARYVCGQASAKIFALSETSVNPSVFPKGLGDLQAHFVELIDALPLNDKFVLVDNSSGLGTCLLWKLRERLAGALVVNPIGWFTEDFYGGEEYQGALQVARTHAQFFETRDVGNASQLVSTLLFADGASDVKSASEEYRQALAVSPSTFWSLQARMADWCMAEATPCYRGLGPLKDMPVIIACGSHSPDLIVQQTVSRLHEHIQGSTIEYIPESKQWWEAEGKEQRMAVAGLLLDVLRMSEKELAAAAKHDEGRLGTSKPEAQKVVSLDEQRGDSLDLEAGLLRPWAPPPISLEPDEYCGFTGEPGWRRVVDPCGGDDDEIVHEARI